MQPVTQLSLSPTFAEVGNLDICWKSASSVVYSVAGRQYASEPRYLLQRLKRLTEA